MKSNILVTLDTIRLLGDELSKKYRSPKGRTYGAVYHWLQAVVSEDEDRRDPSHQIILEKILNTVPNESSLVSVAIDPAIDFDWKDKLCIKPDPDDSLWRAFLKKLDEGIKE